MGQDVSSLLCTRRDHRDLPSLPLHRNSRPLPALFLEFPDPVPGQRGGGSLARGSTPTRPAGTQPCMGERGVGASSRQKVFSPVTECPFESSPGASSGEPLCPWTQPFGGAAEVITRRGTAGDILALSGTFCSHKHKPWEKCFLCDVRKEMAGSQTMYALIATKSEKVISTT